MDNRRYIAIDLKSFYASVECVERGLNPLDTCLVVADESRTRKTICLAVSPAIKAYGTGGRPRLFEVVDKINKVNMTRGRTGKSYSARYLADHPECSVDFLIAKPRMALYIEYSGRIYDVYMRYVAPEDMHVYSIDEVFMDVTSYLETYKMTAHELAMKIIKDILKETGITATAGIGSNLYLSKVAMDIVAKKMTPDEYGVRIAELDEYSYRRKLWDHEPLTDFWRVGAGIASRLASYGIYTMGDIARQSVNNENLLYHLLGVNAELLIDHSWGWEPVDMKHVKSYRPESKSICSGQVLHEPYTTVRARNVVLEMADAVSYELIEKRLVTDQVVLTVGYDVTSLSRKSEGRMYDGAVRIDRYGREVPIHAHGTVNFKFPTSSSSNLMEHIARLYDRIINPDLLVRRISLSINRLMQEDLLDKYTSSIQLNLFDDNDAIIKKLESDRHRKEKERRCQNALLIIKKKFGKNAVLRGLNYTDGATQIDRNRQIGGHKA